MDLENFEAIEATKPSDSRSTQSLLSATDSLEELDKVWYIPASRSARWMDLLGDYAGTELFIIDGESLLELILDDPLLAIGQEKECSFQTLHAYHSLEKLLLQFIQRSANFEVAFWSSNAHISLKTGSSKFQFTSRLLARALLFYHLRYLNIKVHTFVDLNDPNWVAYHSIKKPMFVMTNDGGILKNSGNLEAERILTQRLFVFRILSSGMAVSLLRGAEYRDSKVLSFVYEQSRAQKYESVLQNIISQSLPRSKQLLDAAFCEETGIQSPNQLHFSDDKSPSPNIVLELLVQRIMNLQLPKYTHELLFLFILHALVLPSLSVRERARPNVSLNPELAQLLTSFLPRLWVTISGILSEINGTLDIDGRVFASLVRFCIINSESTLSEIIDPSVHAIAQNIWSKTSAPNLDFQQFSRRFPLPDELVTTQRSSIAQTYRLLPFDNTTFNTELSMVHLPIEEVEESTEKSMTYTKNAFSQDTLFSDTKHWHNQRTILPKHLGGSDPRPTDVRARRRELRSNQRFMASLQLQAATLTGASGAILKQIVIPPVGNSKEAAFANKKPIKTVKEHKPKGKEKPPKLSSADKLRQQIQLEKKSKEEDSSHQWWSEHLSMMSKMTLSEKLSHISLLDRSKKKEDRSIGLEMKLYRLNLEIMQWIEDVNQESPPVRDRYTVAIMRMVKNISDGEILTKSAFKALSAVLQALGFDDYVAGLLTFDNTSQDRALSFPFVKLIKSKTQARYYEFMAITEHPITWQLRLFGEYMDRSMDGASDMRVSFIPDAWQRRVLDCIDADQSLLVVAPTSAGKTFISFYAMEKVLRGSDDGVLIYVAPTKALVSQIAAEVYARFKKQLNKGSLWAIHTRDYRINNSQNCQILVTVPEMLAIMLLSPPLARSWTPRIKRIILDEIHSIGQQEGGAVWEQIILLAPCPIIGLSATIGSPNIFNTWLESVQKAHGYKHTFIEHPHRYSHLRKFFYVFPNDPNPKFSGLVNHLPTSRTKFIHPIAMLGPGTRSIPNDLSLEAQDTLSLYNALVPHKDSLNCDLDALHPVSFFSSRSTLLRQKDILRYEGILKEALGDLILASSIQEQAPLLVEIVKRLTDSALEGPSVNAAPSRKRFLDNLIWLLADLHIKGELPAILFNFDRANCEIMVKSLVTTLTGAEESWRLHDPEWNRKLKQWTEWKARSKEREREASRVKKNQKKNAEGPDSPLVEPQTSWESSFDPEDPSPGFSFCGSHTVYSKAELNSDIEEISRWTSTPQWALDALRRGIAVHHSGMNKRYRSLVESLFRQGFVRVVIATGTLALGINAPAKTSVFCGDSPFLTALMYRQCAGRAGRRGFDLLGHVIFYGLPMDRVQRLILSKLPSLTGIFPLTSTLILRLLNLLEGSGYAPVAVKAVQSIMTLPHVSFGSDIGRHQLLHQVRFSIEYLRRSGLIDSDGKPMNLFAVAAHLYYAEPSNLALVMLLKSGILHEICQRNNFIAAKRQFILLMSHLFGRRYVSKVIAGEKNIEELTRKYPSVIILPPLPKTASTILLEHDRNIIRIFSGYAKAYATEYEERMGPDDKLPLSNHHYPEMTCSLPPPFHKYLRDTSIPTKARSPFVANSGHDDRCFGSIRELTQTAREGLHLHEHSIPSVNHMVNLNGGISGSQEHALNAYILDFYTHGQLATMTNANGIRGGEIWYLLQDFTLTLKTVQASLEQLLFKTSEKGQGETSSDMELGHDNEHLDLDSGYGTLAEREDDEGSNDFGLKPDGVQDKDWQVYEVVNSALGDFEAKFKAIWA